MYKQTKNHLQFDKLFNFFLKYLFMRLSPAAKPRFGALPCFEVFSFFLMDSVSLDIADDQTENWNFVSIDQFKI